MTLRDIIVIGTSAGGVEALKTLAREFPADLPAAVLVVIHSTPDGPYLLPSILNHQGHLEAVQTIDGMPLERGKIYVARPDHHMLVQNDVIRLAKGPRENRARPSIDPLFRSAAQSYGSRVIGVILTGMLDDGTAGLVAVKQHGGLAVVQDPTDALFYPMPENALRHVKADHVVPLVDIAPLLTRLVQESAPRAQHRPDPVPVEVEGSVTMTNVEIEDMDRLGFRAAVSCPECYGPLWRIEEGKLVQFRCHVGHSYTTLSMIEEQSETQERLLWQALRLMKERVLVLQELVEGARLEGRTREADGGARRVARLEKQISAVRELLDGEDDGV